MPICPRRHFLFPLWAVVILSASTIISTVSSDPPPTPPDAETTDESELSEVPNRSGDNNDGPSPSSVPLDIRMGEEQSGRDEVKVESDFDRRLEETQGYLDWYAEEWTANHQPEIEESPQMATCKNQHEFCVYWAMAGHCSRDDKEDYMVEKCAPACFACHNRTFFATNEDDEDYDGDDEPPEMQMCFVEEDPDPPQDQQAQEQDQDKDVGDDTDTPVELCIDTGVKQEMGDDASLEKEYHKNLRLTQQYFDFLLGQGPELSFLPLTCKNRVKWCSFWAASGHCDVDPDYMLENCAPACFACEESEEESEDDE